MHSALLFLKRDSGGNLTGEPVVKRLSYFCTILQNSLPYSSPYNGVAERVQGEVKVDSKQLLFGVDISSISASSSVQS